MAVDYGMLLRTPSVGARFAAGQEAGRAAAAQNMLLQQRQLEFQQAQEDRKLAAQERQRKLDVEQAQVARRGQLAQVLRESGMDPSDLNAATRFYAAALEANEPTALAAARDWVSLAREAATSRAAGAEYQGIMGGAPAPAAPAAPTPMAAPMPAPAPIAAPAPMAAPEPAMAPFGARETYGAGEVSPGGAMSFAVAPQPGAPEPPTGVNKLAPQPAAPEPMVNQLAAAPAAAAPAAPAAPAVPAPVGAPMPAPARDDAAALRAEAQRLEAAQQRLRSSGFEKNQKRAQELDRPIERLYKRAEDIDKANVERPLIVGGRLISPTGQVIYEPPPGPIAPSERYVPVGQDVFDRVEGKFIEGPARAARAAAALRPAPEARVKTAAPPPAPRPPSGYRFTAEGNLEPIPGGPAAGRAPVAPGAKPAEKPATVTEQQASTATQRLLNRATEIANIVQRNRKAEAPTMTEAAMENLPYLSRATNLVRSTDRQIVSSAQDDILDALLYLSTGAAYNKEQLQQQKSAYLPSWSDDAPTRQVKRQRLAQAIEGARVRAGRAWTPELDAAMQRLMEVPVMGGRPPAPAAAPAPAPAAGAAAPLTPAEQAELEALRQRFGGRRP